MKVIHCLQPSDNALDHRIRLLLAEAYRLVGQSYGELQLFDRSSDYYRQAREALLPLHDQSCLYRATFDLGQSLLFNGKYSEAIGMFLQMLDQSTSDSERAFVHQYVSVCYLTMNDLNQAKTNAYQALDYASLANEELLRIEANVLLGKIYFQMKDVSRAKEYVAYAQTVQDQLGDLGPMRRLEDLRSDIDNQRATLTSLLHADDRSRTHSPWISSAMQTKHNQSSDAVEQKSANQHHWRVLTPYYRLFDTCVDRKKKSRRPVDQLKQPAVNLATPSSTSPLNFSLSEQI